MSGVCALFIALSVPERACDSVYWVKERRRITSILSQLPVCASTPLLLGVPQGVQATALWREDALAFLSVHPNIEGIQVLPLTDSPNDRTLPLRNALQWAIRHSPRHPPLERVDFADVIRSRTQERVLPLIQNLSGLPSTYTAFDGSGRSSVKNAKRSKWRVQPYRVGTT